MKPFIVGHIFASVFGHTELTVQMRKTQKGKKFLRLFRTDDDKRRAHSGDAQQHVRLWTTHKHKMCPSQSLDFNQTEVIQIDVHAGIMSELLCCQMANRDVFSPNILQDFWSLAVLCAVWCLCKAHWNSQTQPVCVQIRNPLCVCRGQNLICC